MSGQQTSRLFASGFMAGQESLSEIGQDTIDTHGYDMVGNAHMASVVQVGSRQTRSNNIRRFNYSIIISI